MSNAPRTTPTPKSQWELSSGRSSDVKLGVGVGSAPAFSGFNKGSGAPVFPSFFAGVALLGGVGLVLVLHQRAKARNEELDLQRRFRGNLIRRRVGTAVGHGQTNRREEVDYSGDMVMSVRDVALARSQGLAVTVLTRAVGVEGLVGGQFADLRGGRAERPLHEIAATNGRKTGALFLAAVEIGAIAAGAGETTRAHLRGFATELGHAFQLLDDLLDGGPSAATIGKDVNKDAGKSTIVSMLGRASVEHRIERHVEAAHGELTSVFGASSRLHRLTDAIVALPGRTVADTACAETRFREPEAGAR